ncbi:hypothetical protein EVAR_30945_1 [Eumeta japonica]|uniref:Uncharacterized protein n=1 Tax=Eumeta variegata TaxID=151549 RepID=A0A4C1V544_EUMVA|nr:hypothetical protein EVAR_30945_1 [Eumeta japonica]
MEAEFPPKLDLAEITTILYWLLDLIQLAHCPFSSRYRRFYRDRDPIRELFICLFGKKHSNLQYSEDFSTFCYEKVLALQENLSPGLSWAVTSYLKGTNFRIAVSKALSSIAATRFVAHHAYFPGDAKRGLEKST